MTWRLRSMAALGAVSFLAACSGGGGSAPSITMPTLVTHARYFPIAPGDAHGPAPGATTVACNACHWDVVAGAPTASFRTFTCTGCHGDSPAATGPHSGAAGLASLVTFHTSGPAKVRVDALAAKLGTTFASDDASCLRCHPQGIAVVDHAPIFPLPHRDQAGTVVARCADCHVQPGDRTVLGCAGCHPHDLAATDALHASVPDFAALKGSSTPAQLSSACVRCHPSGVTQVRVADHPNAANGFAIEGAARHSGPIGGACLSCHQDLGTDPLKPLAANFKVTTCIGCHVAVGGGATLHDNLAELTTLHAGVTTFTSTVTAKGLSAACLYCHADGQAGHPPGGFPIGAGTAHASVTCAQCHTDPANRKSLTALACLGCHQGLAGAGRYPGTHLTAGAAILLTTGTSCRTTGFSPASADCLKCHADSQADLVTSHPATQTTFGTGAHQGAGCLTCHIVLRTNKTYPAIDFTQPAPASQGTAGCATCHNNGCGGN